MPRDAYEVMDLKSLKCFFVAARHGSLTRAGRLRLTAAGERTAQLAVSVFGEIEALEQAVGAAQEGSEIVLASHDSVLRHLLPDKVEAFTRAHPLARLRLIARPIAEIVRLVQVNECDLGVVPKVPIPTELHFAPIASYPACMIIPRGHALARRVPEGFAAVMSDGMTGRYPLIILEVQREDPRLQQAFERHNVPFNVALEVSTVDTLKHYVARGMGIAVISGFSVTREDRQRFEMLAVPEDVAAATTYGVLTRRDKKRTPLLRSLVSILAAAE